SAVRNRKCQRMLVGMHVRRRSQRIATVDMREIQKRSVGTIRVDRGNRTLVEVNRSGIKISGIAGTGLGAIRTIWNRQEFKVIEPLLHAAAFKIAAIENATVADLCPRATAVEALPDPLVDGIIVCIRRSKPDIRLISSRHHGNFTAKERAGRAVVRRTSSGAE